MRPVFASSAMTLTRSSWPSRSRSCGWRTRLQLSSLMCSSPSSPVMRPSALRSSTNAPYSASFLTRLPTTAPTDTFSSSAAAPAAFSLSTTPPFSALTSST